MPSSKNIENKWKELNDKALKSYHSLTNKEKTDLTMLYQELNSRGYFDNRNKQTFSEKEDNTSPFGNPFMS